MHEDTFATVQGGAEETYSSADYLWDNRGRNELNLVALQRTVDGAAFFSDRHGRKLVPRGHAMIFTLSERSSYGYPPEAHEPYRLRYLNFTSTAVLRPLIARLREDFGSVLRMPDDAECTLLFQEIFTRFRQRTFSDRFHESELLHRLLVTLYREQAQEIHAADPVEFGYQYLQSHFRQPLNLKTVAQKCGITREHFIRKFTARYGEPPGHLLRRLRMDHASAMLAATRLSVEDIALASGFTSANTFGRAYRTKFGRSPRATDRVGS